MYVGVSVCEYAICPKRFACLYVCTHVHVNIHKARPGTEPYAQLPLIKFFKGQQ